MPETESHAPALSSIPEGKRTEVWKEAVNDSGKTGKPVTAKSIKNAGEKVGVSTNIKAPANRKATKNAFDEHTEPTDSLSNKPLKHASKAINSSWIDQTESASLDSIAFGANDEEGPTETAQSNQELKEKLLSAMLGEIMVTIAGSFLIRQGLVEKWQSLRGYDREINEDYTDKLSIQELLKLISV